MVCKSVVSILLLLDVAGKLRRLWRIYQEHRSFNPSSSGCGWKTENGLHTLTFDGTFQSFFFWMWLENTVATTAGACTMICFNPSSSGCGWKTSLLFSHYGKVICFNPSSSGCGWKTSRTTDFKMLGLVFQSFFFWMWLENEATDAMVEVFFNVSILLLLDVAGKLGTIKAPRYRNHGFQSFFFWMWLENSA